MSFADNLSPNPKKSILDKIVDTVENKTKIDNIKNIETKETGKSRTIYLRDNTFNEIKELANKQGVSYAQLINQALIEFINK